MAGPDVIDYDDRTEDVIIKENLDFDLLIYEEKLLKGLLNAGFIKPSPIQLAAIPKAFCGCDLIIQAKSGTGKSCVFILTALKKIKIHNTDLQAIIIAPTREISIQNRSAILTIGKYIKGLRVEYFIGGTPIADDIKKIKGCHIAVGAPGRINHLIKKGYLNTKSVNLIVFDEADKLMETSFVNDIWEIHCACPAEKQVIACSATFTTDLLSIIRKYTKNGVHITPGMKAELVLFGVKQFVSIINRQISSAADFKNKVKWVSHLLSVVKFNQCIIFTNYNLRVTKIYSLLVKENWGVSYLNSKLSQEKRIDAYNNLKSENAQILITTDVSARGIDVQNVNLVINFDIPYDYVTYLHRMGRAGRFGSYGMVINIIQKGEELSQFQKMLQPLHDKFSIYILPKDGLHVDSVFNCEEHFQKLNVNVREDEIISDSTSEEVINYNENNQLIRNKNNVKVKETRCAKQNKQMDNGIDCIPAIESNLDNLECIGCECKILEIDPKSVVECNETLYAINKDFQTEGTLFQVSKSLLPLSVPFVEVEGKLVTLGNSEKVPLQYKSISHNETDIENLMQEKSNKQNIKSLKKQKMSKSLLTLIENFQSNNDIIKEKVHEMQSIHRENTKRNVNLLELCNAIKQYDLLGWLCVEEDCNLISNIQEQNPDVFKLGLTKCEGNKLHIKTSKISNLDTFLLNKDDNIVSNYVTYALDMTSLPIELSNQSLLNILNCFGTYKVINKSSKIERYKENSMKPDSTSKNNSPTQHLKCELYKISTGKCYSAYANNTSIKQNSKSDMNTKCKDTSLLQTIGKERVKGKCKNTSNRKPYKENDLIKRTRVLDEQSNKSLYSTTDGTAGLCDPIDHHNWIPIENDYSAERSNFSYHNPSRINKTYKKSAVEHFQSSELYYNTKDEEANGIRYSNQAHLNQFPKKSYNSATSLCNCCPDAGSINNVFKRILEYDRCSESSFSTDSEDDTYHTSEPYLNGLLDEDYHSAVCSSTCCDGGKSVNNIFKWISEYNHCSESSSYTDSEDG